MAKKSDWGGVGPRAASLTRESHEFTESRGKREESTLARGGTHPPNSKVCWLRGIPKERK